MDLFSYSNDITVDEFAPLANRMRPTNLEQFIGQEHIVGSGTLLRRAIEADKLTSIIFYGPPGTGKTTLAEIISRNTESVFINLHAVKSGVKDIRELVEKATERKLLYQKRTTLFIDEIHHFNKTQQDALLPFVENGTIILIGATTENPFFEVNDALLSRSMIFTLNELNEKDLVKILEQALIDKDRGLGRLNINIEESAQNHLINYANGDARKLLNAIELAVATTSPNQNGVIDISLTVAEQSIQAKAVKYDKSGDKHYDVISAFIKSIRGSDPDAAIFWLARMLDAGENPRFIARRLIISASEDIGNADPNALNVAVAAFQAYELLGMPEGRIPLAQATTYLATAPKSNAAYKAINLALDDIKNLPFITVPLHLRDASYKGSTELGHGIGYLYPHNYEKNYVEQLYLPQNISDKKYYKPTCNGYEETISKHMNNLTTLDNRNITYKDCKKYSKKENLEGRKVENKHEYKNK